MTMSKAASLAGTPLDQVLSDLETSRVGLTEAEAQARLKQLAPTMHSRARGTRSRFNFCFASSTRSF